MEKTAGILIIGNEILSGKVTDDNSPFLCRELRGLGIDVKQLAVLPDDEEVIAAHVRAWSDQYHLIFTCGGVGPTPDDVTIAGIAKGLGKKVIRDASLISLIQGLYAQPLTEAMLKLSEVPEGADLIVAEGLRYPVIVAGNIYILPGIPEILRKKFNALKGRFKSTPFCLKKIFVKCPEMEIAHHLFAIAPQYPSLQLGSYPALSETDYQVMLTLESKDEQSLDQAFLHLLSLLPREIVFKTE